MASPLPSGKKPVNLASAGPRASRIRRDPPPIVKEKLVDVRERDEWDVTLGVIVFTLTIFVILLAFASYSGWSPQEYTLYL
jgi:hypothetical protein